MWKSNLQYPKTSSAKANQNLQHLSPFASHSSVQSTTSSTTTTTTPSARNGTQLPAGIRYIRQTPDSVYRSVRLTTDAPALPHPRSASPTKSTRFADPLLCSKKSDKTDSNSKTTTKTKSLTAVKSRPLVRPVIGSDSTKTSDSKKTSSKTVAVSPASGLSSGLSLGQSSRQTSPIFSSVDFGGDNKRLNKQTLDSKTKNGKYSSGESTPVSSPIESQTKTLIEIKTPKGTVKRSEVMAPTNGTIHRNTLSFPIGTDRNSDPNQSRLSVNVNVAVGVETDAINRFVGHKYDIQSNEDLNSNQFEDEIDFNTIDDRIGSELKVAVRLRPFIHSEIDSQTDIPVIDMNGSTVRIINSDNENYNRMEFGFAECLNSSDKDLFEYADQDRVYHTMGAPLLERALEGYNVCLFAYGQTGSGKSFTMMGTDLNPGIIPRFIRELFRKFDVISDTVFTVSLSYYEVYNEKIYDLLSDDKNNNKKILRIREHPQTGPYVDNLSQHEVETYNNVMDQLRIGNKRRATASTAANSDSSRSHSIFTMVLSQMRKSEEFGLDMSCSCESRINLIDLAGSERVGCSGTSGERLKEGSLINKSLLNLGKVISKLAELGSHPNKFAHIPYRDSALTWLLKESLGGNSRTSMIATISPAKCHLEETLSTLRYAATARRIVNYVHINEDPKSKKIRELMEEIAILREKTENKAIKNEELICEKKKSIECHLEAKSLQTISKGTNTSFGNLRTSTKGTDTSFSQTKTCSIATNTSFIKKPVQTCSTATEMSFRETRPKRVDTSTATTFVDLPTDMDLMRMKQLEDEQQKLLEDIRRQRELLLGKKFIKSPKKESKKVSENEDLSEKSDTFYDCSEVVTKKEVIQENNEEWGSVPVGSEDTVDTKEEWDTGDGNGIQSEQQNEQSNENNDESNWGTEGNNLGTEENNWGTEENNWGTDTAQTDEHKDVDYGNEENGDNWGTEGTEDKAKDNPQEESWGQDLTLNADHCNESGQATGTTRESSHENKGSEWGTEGKNETNEWETDNNNTGGNDWGTDGNTGANEWGTEQNTETTEWGTNGNTGANEWATEDTTKTNEWGTDDNTGGEDWGTHDTVNNEDQENGDQNAGAFDWGTDQTDTTVIDKNEPKGGDDWDENW